MTYLLPLVLAARAGEDFDVMAALRNDCPLLAKEHLAGQNVAALLGRLKTDVDGLTENARTDESGHVYPGTY